MKLSALSLVSAMSRAERTTLLVLSSLVLVSGAFLLRAFYVDVTEEVPTIGGTYIEGSVGEIHSLNPWFTVASDVNSDVVSLVFAGLLRYDPHQRSIVEDLATMEISNDNRIYTLKLREGLLWHDSTPENPHPVTADDVVFTYATVQDEDFPNSLLRQNFRGVTLEKIDDRTVQFRLEKPYAFFSSNLTLGLLPARHFEGVPVDRLDQTLDFGFNPVGSGPYKFVSMIQTDLSTEVTLQLFSEQPGNDAKIERIVFRVFPDYTSLLSDLPNLDGVRLVPRNEEGVPILPRGFKEVPYSLPQYVALFFNLDRDIVKGTQLRLGLQLATDKQEIVDSIHESKIIDTPLMEIDLGDWRYKFDPDAAQGAFVDSRWHLPEKVRLQQLQERSEANKTGSLTFYDQIVYLDTGAVLTLTGALEGITLPASVHGVPVSTGGLAPGVWMAKIPAGSSVSGSLIPGLNRVRMTDADGKIVDTAYIERFIDRDAYRTAIAEQELLADYESAKASILEDAIEIEDMIVDGGALRLRKEDDPPSIRVGEGGEPLRLTLITSGLPASYGEIAGKIAEQWRKVGVQVDVVIPETRQEFEERMLSRNYDVLLFGQSLLDNLDSYPYWHSSQTQDASGDRGKLKLDAFNLSQYTSFDADALLTRIRETRDVELRQKSLGELHDIFKRDVPAIVLYSPTYIFGYREDLAGLDVGSLSQHSDRFLTLNGWFIHTDRRFKEGKSWWSFFTWLPTLLTSDEE